MLSRLGVIVLAILIGSASYAIADGSGEAKSAHGNAPVKVLIIDGQNNHDAWPKSTIMMKKYFIAAHIMILLMAVYQVSIFGFNGFIIFSLIFNPAMIVANLIFRHQCISDYKKLLVNNK